MIGRHCKKSLHLSEYRADMQPALVDRVCFVKVGFRRKTGLCFSRTAKSPDFEPTQVKIHFKNVHHDSSGSDKFDSPQSTDHIRNWAAAFCRKLPLRSSQLGRVWRGWGHPSAEKVGGNGKGEGRRPPNKFAWIDCDKHCILPLLAPPLLSGAHITKKFARNPLKRPLLTPLTVWTLMKVRTPESKRPSPPNAKSIWVFRPHPHSKLELPPCRFRLRKTLFSVKACLYFLPHLT